MSMDSSGVAVKRLSQAIDEFEAACGRDPNCKDLVQALAPVKDEISEYGGGKDQAASPGRRAASEAASGGPTSFAGAKSALNAAK